MPEVTAKPTTDELIAALADPRPLLDQPAVQRLIASTTPAPPHLTLVAPPPPLVEPPADADVWVRSRYARKVHSEALAVFRARQDRVDLRVIRTDAETEPFERKGA